LNQIKIILISYFVFTRNTFYKVSNLKILRQNVEALKHGAK